VLLQKINRSGFTIIELMIVIAIIAIAATILIPLFAVVLNNVEVGDTDVEIVEQTGEEITQEVVEPPKSKEENDKL